MDAPLHTLTLPELRDLFAAQGLNPHQALLTFRALHRHGLREPARMEEISARARGFVETLPPLPLLTVDAVHPATDGTTKLRLRTPSGDAVETVIIPQPNRVTVCLSSQVGCAAGCAFCHTATMGLRRNLAAWEMVEQVRVAQTISPRRITNIVFMGMGEPLHNEAQVVRACRILGDDNGGGFAKKRLVVSTAGVGNRLRPFWDEDVGVLAVSLHATTDAVRSRLVPLNRQWDLSVLRDILLSIPWRRGESVLVAYLLLDGVNDSREDAERLADWLVGLPAKVNLLEFNAFPGGEFQRTPPERFALFRQWLDARGVTHMHRVSRGQDALAACGQLAVPELARRKPQPHHSHK